MKRLFLLLLCLIFCMSTVGAVSAQAPSGYENGEVFVEYQNGEIEVLSLGDRAAETIASLERDETVASVQPNYSYHATASDEYFDQQWALVNDGSFSMREQGNPFPVFEDPFGEMQLPWEWEMPEDFGRRRNSFWQFGFPFWPFGQQKNSAPAAGIDVNYEAAKSLYRAEREVIVALIDTGVDNSHEDLSGKLWYNEDEIPGNGIDDDGNGYIDDTDGWNFYHNNNCIYTGEEDAHGTHCAGTMVAESDNGVGIAGLIPGYAVKVMPIKALGGYDGSGSTESIVRAIRYAEENGAKICNLSLGTSNDDPALYRAIAESDMLFVVAAGNDGMNTDWWGCYPASYDLDNLISVANLTYSGELDYSSNYGKETVDLAAPGAYILSTTPGQSYSFMSGTSMAAPMVTAAAAMVYSGCDGLSLAEVKDRLLRTVTPLDPLDSLVASGGMLDLGAALSGEPSSQRKIMPVQTEPPEQYENSRRQEASASGSLPEIEVSTISSFGETYLIVRVTDPDGDVVKTCYTEGEADAETVLENGTEFALSEDGTAVFVPRKGLFTFCAMDAEGNWSSKTVQISERDRLRFDWKNLLQSVPWFF